ncbi:hypothetical protein C0J52_05280 [Blattella germanica]|nr:hypothetical protein C0J52_05280 [Blattella germanica]
MEQQKEFWSIQCVSCSAKICDDSVSCKINKQGTIFVSGISRTVKNIENEAKKSLVCSCGEIVGEIMSTKTWKYRLNPQKINRSLKNKQAVQENAELYKYTSSSDVQASGGTESVEDSLPEKDRELLDKMTKRVKELEERLKGIEEQSNEKFKDLCQVIFKLKMDVLKHQEIMWALHPNFALISNFNLNNTTNDRTQHVTDSSDTESGYGSVETGT